MNKKVYIFIERIRRIRNTSVRKGRFFFLRKIKGTVNSLCAAERVWKISIVLKEAKMLVVQKSVFEVESVLLGDLPNYIELFFECLRGAIPLLDLSLASWFSLVLLFDNIRFTNAACAFYLLFRLAKYYLICYLELSVPRSEIRAKETQLKIELRLARMTNEINLKLYQQFDHTTLQL